MKRSTECLDRIGRQRRFYDGFGPTPNFAAVATTLGRFAFNLSATTWARDLASSVMIFIDRIVEEAPRCSRAFVMPWHGRSPWQRYRCAQLHGAEEETK